jgi:hypothetical protein
MDSESGLTVPRRRRLPNRRSSLTQELLVGSIVVTVGVGFDAAGRAAELFLNCGKTGSAIDMLLDDAAVAISVALQHGVPARALAKSISRTPERVDGPATLAASAIGAALDLLVEFEASQSG